VAFCIESTRGGCYLPRCQYRPTASPGPYVAHHVPVHGPSHENHGRRGQRQSHWCVLFVGCVKTRTRLRCGCTKQEMLFMSRPCMPTCPAPDSGRFAQLLKNCPSLIRVPGKPGSSGRIPVEHIDVVYYRSKSVTGRASKFMDFEQFSAAFRILANQRCIVVATYTLATTPPESDDVWVCSGTNLRLSTDGTMEKRHDSLPWRVPTSLPQTRDGYLCVGCSPCPMLLSSRFVGFRDDDCVCACFGAHSCTPRWCTLP